MKVAFLGRLQINMKDLLNVVKNKLGKSLKIDDLRISPDHPLAYLTTLTDFKDVLCDFSNLGSLLDQDFYTYIVSCSERHMMDLIQESGLTIVTTVDNELGIVGGSLAKWRTAVLNGCSESSVRSYREFANLVLADMEKQGLNQLWKDYSKVRLKDTTFKLSLHK